MSKLLEKPYIAFFLAIPMFILLGILKGDELLSLNIHDTYFVISALHLAIFISIILGIIGLGYWLAYKGNKKLSERLIWVHLALTFVGILCVWLLSQFYRTEFIEYEFNNKLSSTITILIFLVALGQLLFPINLILSHLKKEKNI